MVLQRRICEGFLLNPRGSRRATLVKHVIELPYLCVCVCLWCPLRASLVDPILVGCAAPDCGFGIYAN